MMAGQAIGIVQQVLPGFNVKTGGGKKDGKAGPESIPPAERVMPHEKCTPNRIFTAGK